MMPIQIQTPDFLSVSIRRVFCMFFVFVMAVAYASGGQSVVFNPNRSASFTDPSYPVDSLWRAEAHLSNLQHSGAGTKNIVLLSGIGARLRIWEGNSIALYDHRNTYNVIGGRAHCLIDTSGRTNILIRWQRTPSGMVCEIWNIDGSGYAIRTHTRTASGSENSGGTFGEVHTNMPSVHLGFFRIHYDNVPTGSRPPVTADVGNRDWKFDGNGVASAGGNNINTNGFTFTNTDVGPGIAAAINTGDPRSWMPFGPLRAGYMNHITSNSYTMADQTSQVECLWQQVPHDEGEPLTSEVKFLNRTDCNEPGITGLIHGPYRFRLRVKDPEGRTAEAEQDFGAVAYDNNGVIIYPDDRLYAILGPMKVLGQNPWEWADRQSILMASNNWNNYSVFGGTWDPEWIQKVVNGMPREGVVYRSFAANRKVYGTGTNFLDVFCGGSVGDVVGGGAKYIAVYRPMPYMRQVVSCQSDTEITTEAWTHSGIPDIESPGTEYWGTYGFVDVGTQGGWRGGNTQSNVNYYDNALAHYRLYYQSGWRDAHVAARWLADRWLSNPWNRSGNQAREASYIGMMIRLVIDGGLDELGWDPLPALRSWMNTEWSCIGRSSGSGNLNDVRETAYCTIMKAMTALLDPDPAEAAAAKNNLQKGAIDKWKNHQGPNGNWFDNATGSESRVSIVSNGSSRVTKHSGTDYPANYCGVIATDIGEVSIGSDRITMEGVGTNFTGMAGNYLYLTGIWNGKPWAQVSRILSSSTPTETKATLSIPWRGDLGSPITNWAILESAPFNDNSRIHQVFFDVNASGARISNIDSEWYWCKRVNGAEIALDRPYAGDTSDGNHYRQRDGFLNLGLAGSSPFYHGIVSYGFYLAWQAIKDDYPAEGEVYRELLVDTAKWILSDDSYNPMTKGLRYASRSAPACGGGGSIGTAFGCWGTTANSGRSYNIETIQGLSFFYLVQQDKNLQSALDGFYNGTYARTGYASLHPGDGNWNEATDEVGYRTSVNLGTKNYGQAWGIGGGQTWPAARLGGVASPKRKSSSVSFRLEDAPGATSAKIILRSPSGARSTYTCATSPCAVEVDLRQGDHLYQIWYLNGAGKVVSRSQEQVLSVGERK